VRKLRESGIVLLGKLNTHEYAYGGTTNNPHYGPTHNPWKLDRIPGGSSGGSAAATAAGLATGTLGSDTAGSIRMPAALCGVVGLKPTYGRVSAAGVTALSWSYDHVGPIARSVEDAAIILQAIAGYDPADFGTVRVPVDDYTTHLREGIRGLRVGVPRRYFFEGLDEDVHAGVEQAIGVLLELGATIRDVDLPGIEAVPRLTGLNSAEAQIIHAESLATRPDDFGRDVYDRLTQPVPDGLEVARQAQQIRAFGAAVRGTLEGVDVLVTPMMAVGAPRIGQETLPFMGVEERLSTVLTRFARPFNLTGLPALSVPCGFTREGLPIGLQIAGRPFDEALVLRVGYAYEQATEWHLRRPEGLEAG
jgi:aspartyl-tRNA(Asn)/glutamyl-tRNA(Gln) amidotransferase subunit A